eukprot:123737_1
MSLLCFLILCLIGAIHAFSEEQRKYIDGNIETIDNTVSKPETICIMTRDNICLSTTVYLPSGTGKFSAVYAKTPYGKITLASTATEWTEQGYCVITQDCRGKGQSNGSYSFWRTSGNDSIDTIEWALQPQQTEFSNGLFAVTGTSANALAQYADEIGITQGGGGTNGFNKHNTILNHGKAGYLSWGDGLGYETSYQGGAYRTGLITGWLDLIGEKGTVTTVLENEAFDAWWYPLVGNWTQWDTTNHPNEPQWAVTNLSIVHSSGWYDIFSLNQIKTAIGVNNTAQINAKGNQVLLVDPGGHCGGGAIKWPNASWGGNKMSQVWGPAMFNGAMDAAAKNKLFNVHEYIPWNFLFYMLGPGLERSVGNYWVSAEGFPPVTNTYYFMDGNAGNDNGVLSTTTPKQSGSNSYMYDPKNPVTTYGGNNLIISPCGPQSQEKNEKGRKDILHYTSEELSSNMAVVGLITAHLYVGSDAIDTDFTAKVIDIFPNGTPMLVQDGILRMRWRDGPYHSNVSPKMVKGQIYEIIVEVGYMAYIFNSGHKISLSVSSSNYERFSVNYNNGNFVIEGDKNPVIANNTVYYGGDHQSALVLPVIDLQWANERMVELW